MSNSGNSELIDWTLGDLLNQINVSYTDAFELRKFWISLIIWQV